MAKRLHTLSKIFFKNPLVLQVVYDADYSTCIEKHRKICNYTYKTIQGTWGFSTLFVEWVGNSSLTRAYFVFENEADLLQFRLYIDHPTKIVSIWPNKTFTIHEYVEEDGEYQQ